MSDSTRILASHGGVLPRPDNSQAMADGGKDEAFEQRLPSAVAEGVQKQIDLGMDVVNDGEYVKRSGFNGYIRERIAGLEPRPARPTPDAGSIWEDVKLPDDKVIMPGVVGHATDIIEHPELVAQRLGRFARLVGPERVMAGTDSGLGTRVGHAEIAWAKLAAIAEGCRLASAAL